MHVELKCIPFVESTPAAHHSLLKARDVMVKPVITFNEVETVRNVLQQLQGCNHNGFPVVGRTAWTQVGSERVESAPFVGMVCFIALPIVV